MPTGTALLFPSLVIKSKFGHQIGDMTFSGSRRVSTIAATPIHAGVGQTFRRRRRRDRRGAGLYLEYRLILAHDLSSCKI